MPEKKPFTFGQVAIFGRNLDEYVKMFNLDLQSLQGKRILDCCAGPSSFASQATSLGFNVVACDPIYRLDVDTIRTQIDKDVAYLYHMHEIHGAQFYPTAVSVAERRHAMDIFLNDFNAGKIAGRYVFGQLPHLPFSDLSFDLTLCANFLFIYSDKASGGMMDHVQFDYQFHRNALMELMRVTKDEVRIYPLHGVGVQHHAFIEPLMEACNSEGYHAEIVPVAQRDIIGAEHMLRITQ